jgi:tetratricopeptide (TPR) repeat protein
MQLKAEADLKFAESNLDEAVKLYEDCLEIDPQNEYVYANLGLIYMMRQDYNKCIEYSTKSLDIIEDFLNDTKAFTKENRLEVKILMRRGKSYEQLEDLEKAKVDLDKALMMEPQNGEAKVIAKRVQDRLDSIAYEEFNKQAVEYQKA